MVTFAKFRLAPKGTRKIGGVCAGLAYFLGIPVWITRVVTFLSIFFLVHTLLVVYILLWIFAPVWPTLPEDFAARTKD